LDPGAFGMKEMLLILMERLQISTPGILLSRKR
jgi:hypothetical protein